MNEFIQILDHVPGTRSATPKFLALKNIHDLIAVLQKHRIPLATKWGKGRAKDCPTLFNQLVIKNEAKIFEGTFKRRLRLITHRRVLTIRFCHDVPRGEVVYDLSPYVFTGETIEYRPNRLVEPRPLSGRLVCVEFRQEFGRGGFALGQHPDNISETMIDGESLLEALIRACVEELSFIPTPRERETIRPFEVASWNGMYGYDIPLEEGFERHGPSESKKYPGTLSIKDIAPHLMLLFENFNSDGYIERDDNKLSVFKWLTALEHAQLFQD